jgi:hypothetical protein
MQQRLHRRPSKHSAGSAEFLYLIVVLAAGVATAWYAGHRIGFDLSGITTMASVLGLTENAANVQHAAVGYTPGAAAQAAAPDEAAGAPAAVYCNPGQAPTFALGLAALKQRLGDTMGTPIECEHPASADGDTIQQTTTGLAAYDHATNTVSFTDGWHHWAITPGGFVSWEGTDPNPPTG